MYSTMRVLTSGVMMVVACAFAILVLVAEDMMSLSGLRRLCVYLFSLGGISAPTRSTGRKYQREIIFYLEILGLALFADNGHLCSRRLARSKAWLHHQGC